MHSTLKSALAMRGHSMQYQRRISISGSPKTTHHLPAKLTSKTNLKPSWRCAVTICPVVMAPGARPTSSPMATRTAGAVTQIINCRPGSQVGAVSRRQTVRQARRNAKRHNYI
jgi:hypothetical protein